MIGMRMRKKTNNIKKLRPIVWAVLIALIVPFTSAPAETEDEPPDLEAKNVLLVRLTEDLETDEILYDRGSDELIYPASILKMLTALTALDIADPEEKAWVGLEYFLIPSDASRAGLRVPMRLSVRDLLEGLLLPSGADAAYTLAAYCGKKLEKEKEFSPTEAINHFVEAMNLKAADLGAENTTVINVDGYDAEGQMSTAQDLLVIAQAFLEQPLLAEICAMPVAELDGGIRSTITVRNSNEMLQEDSAYYNRDVTGIKTGSTSLAGNCLVSKFDIQGDKYVCIVMNSSYYGRYSDTQKLYEMCL